MNQNLMTKQIQTKNIAESRSKPVNKKNCRIIFENVYSVLLTVQCTVVLGYETLLSQDNSYSLTITKVIKRENLYS